MQRSGDPYGAPQRTTFVIWSRPPQVVGERTEGGRGQLPVAWVNRLQMHQVLANLVGDAVAYAPPGARVMLGTAHQQVGGKEFVGAVVNNSGTLILPEDMSRLFERFYRGDVGRQSGEPGTGLGLAISKEIVELHHGWIDVESSEQGGTTFSVWLPSTPQA